MKIKKQFNENLNSIILINLTPLQPPELGVCALLWKETPLEGMVGSGSAPPARRNRWPNALLAISLLLVSVLGLALLGRTGRLVQAPTSGSNRVGVPPQRGVLLRKAGPVRSLLRLAAISPQAGRISGADREEAERPRAWLEARMVAFHNGSSPPPPLPPWCSIMRNDKYKLIFAKCAQDQQYCACILAGTPAVEPTHPPNACPPHLRGPTACRSPKTGSSTVLNFFGECIPPETDPSHINKPTCLRWLNATNPADVAHMIAAWPEYFVFSFSRSILDRAVSMVSEVLIRTMQQEWASDVAPHRYSPSHPTLYPTYPCH